MKSHMWRDCRLVAASFGTALTLLAASPCPGNDRPAFAEIWQALEQCKTQPLEQTTAPKGSPLDNKIQDCLSLVQRCHWQRAAEDFRRILDTHPNPTEFKTLESLLLLLTLEYTAAQPVQDVEALFDAKTRQFDQNTGRLTLRFDDCQKAQELDGQLEGGGGAIVLSRGNVVRLKVPFIKYGADTPLAASADKTACDITFSCRLMGLNSGDAMTIAVEVRREPTVFAKPFLKLGKKSNGQLWMSADTERSLSKEAQHRVSERRLPDDTFSTWRTVTMVCSRQRVVFSMDPKLKETVGCPDTGTAFVVLTGEGKGVSLDWMEMAGNVDGFWLAGRMVLAHKDQVEKFYLNMVLPQKLAQTKD